MGSSYQRLDVWNVAMELATSIYELTKQLPPDERFGLISQMRRAAISVPSNIAEGQGRGSIGEARQFTKIARGSLAELETQVFLARDLHSLPGTEPVLATIDRVRQMLTKLHDSLREQGAEYEPSSFTSVFGNRYSEIEKER